MRTLFDNLWKSNSKAGCFFRMDASNQAGPTIYLYTIIGKGYDWETGEIVGMSAMDFIKALDACGNAPVVHLRINSPGGDVFEAKAIQTAMMQYPGQIVCHIDGLAASAAAGLVPYASTVEMSVGAFLMIHKAWCLAAGNTDDMLSVAGILEQMDQSIAADFARKTGMETAQIIEMMSKTTYIDANTAKEQGFCDSVYEPEQKVENRFDLSVYGNGPEGLRPVAPASQEPAKMEYDRAYIERRLACIERI